jgi:transposase
MARALSQDLRSRVIVAIEGGLSCRAAAKRFGVGIATAIRWLKAWRTEGRRTALPMGGDLRSQRIEAFARVILGAIEARVDITLVEMAELLEREHGAKFAPSTIWRFLDRHGMTFKKNRARQRAASSGRGPAAAGLVRRPA